MNLDQLLAELERIYHMCPVETYDGRETKNAIVRLYNSAAAEKSLRDAAMRRDERTLTPKQMIALEYERKDQARPRGW